MDEYKTRNIDVYLKYQNETDIRITSHGKSLQPTFCKKCHAKVLGYNYTVQLQIKWKAIAQNNDLPSTVLHCI